MTAETIKTRHVIVLVVQFETPGQIHYMNYNFALVHQTLRVTQAMEADITDHVWKLQ
jgi:hypothetical protein